MEIALAVLANGARILPSGNLDLVEIFDTIPAPGVPVHAPDMVLVVTARHEYEDRLRCARVLVDLLDEDARSVARAEREWEVGEVRPGSFGHSHTIVSFNRSLVFERFGRYRFVVTLDGGARADVVFQVLPVHQVNHQR